MKGDWKYILYFSAAIILFVLVKIFAPKQYDWTVTYAHEDRNPFGAYALHELMPSLFKGKKIEVTYETVYEIKDSLKRSGNLFILANSFTPDEVDVLALLRHVDKGGSAFISAERWAGTFADTLGLDTDTEYKWGPEAEGWRRDTTALRFVAAAYDSSERYNFRRDNIDYWFSKFDTVRAKVISRNSEGKAVALKVKWGKGNLILHSAPLVFTNINLLSNNTRDYVAGIISYMPVHDIQWTGFYQVGRMEAQSPLRFVLRQEPLRWAYFITIIALFVFMVFEMKRRQRIIPVLAPPENSTLEFVATIGNLYYQNKEHKNIAEKKILFLLEQVRSHYYMSSNKIDDAFVDTLSRKSGKPKEQVQELFRLISYVRSRESIPAEALVKLNTAIEEFTENKIKVS